MNKHCKISRQMCFWTKKNKDNSKTKKQSDALPPPSNKHIKKLSLKYFILTFHYQAIF